MSVTIRPYRGGGWEVDIRVVSPDGTRHKRERKHAPISSRTAVGRWAAARERVLFERLLSPPKDHPRKEVPHPTRIRAALRRRPRTSDLTMTQRYMHLSPAALDAAIGLLERPSGEQSCGDILATGSPLQK